MTSAEGEPGRIEKIAQEDIDAVTEQLQSWITTLPEQEQLVLGWILTRAAAAPTEDVAGYYGQYSSYPVSQLLARAAGIQSYLNRAVTIGPKTVWTFRFGAQGLQDRIR